MASKFHSLRSCAFAHDTPFLIASYKLNDKWTAIRMTLQRLNIPLPSWFMIDILVVGYPSWPFVLIAKRCPPSHRCVYQMANEFREISWRIIRHLIQDMNHVILRFKVHVAWSRLACCIVDAVRQILNPSRYCRSARKHLMDGKLISKPMKM